MDVKLWDGKCDEITITRSIRRDPPTHFLLKIESYSLLSETVLEKYESVVFEACGHNWRLYLYPKGNEKMNGRGHISVYLAYAETEKLSLGLEVNASFKFFVYDQIRDNYFTIQDAFGIIRKFNERKTEWGFAKFLPLDTFNNESHGYLVTDCCIFGVEVFVYERSRKRECVFMIKEPADRTLTWKIERFSTLVNFFYSSQEFTVGDFKWKLEVYPMSNEAAKANISVFLCSCDCVTAEVKIYAEFKLRIRDQNNNNHKEKITKHWFSFSGCGWGFSQFLSRKELEDTSKGFLVNDTLIVEAEIMVITDVKQFS